jgi:hypothetical protein
VTLAFPLHPPGKPEKSRIAELLAPVTVGLPLLAVQGERDPFGTPEEVRAALPPGVRKGVRLVAVAGDHGLKPGVVAAGAAVRDFLDDLSG